MVPSYQVGEAWSFETPLSIPGSIPPTVGEMPVTTPLDVGAFQASKHDNKNAVEYTDCVGHADVNNVEFFRGTTFEFSTI